MVTISRVVILIISRVTEKCELNGLATVSMCIVDNFENPIRIDVST